MNDFKGLQVIGLTKRYGQLTAVDNLSFEATPGEVLGLLGPNGAGKSTTMNMICGLVKPDGGRVLPEKASVGVCPQAISLWSNLTCIEQLEFIGEMHGLRRRSARERGGSLLAALGLEDKARMLPRALSGGMQRRLNLAMAVVHDPDVVILDEPEAGLDPQVRVLVRDFIKGLSREKIVILSTHNMDEAERVAGRVAIVDRGRLLALGSALELKRRFGRGEILEFAFATEGDAHRAGGVLEQVTRVADMPPGIAVAVTVVGKHVTVQAANCLALLPPSVNALAQEGLQPQDASLRGASLEDVFLELTGRRLRE